MTDAKTGSEAVTSGVAQWMKLFASQQWQALSDLYSTDCKVFLPGQDVITGRNALNELWMGVHKAGTTTVTLTTMCVEEKDGGKAVAEEGDYKMLKDDGSEVDAGKYVVVWKKVGDKWFLHYDIFNTDKVKAENGDKPKPKSAELRDELAAAYVDWEHQYQSKDFKKLAELYTTDCKVFSPGQPVAKGREACSKAFEGASSAGIAKIVLRSNDVLDMGNDMASDSSYYWMYNQEGQQVDNGKAVVVWKKIDGHWKMYYDIFNSNRA